MRSAALDGWRGVAVLTLLAGHFVPGLGLDAPAWSANFGRVGVELFLALSGCLMGTLLFREHTPLRRFAVRRLARTVPSMWLFLAVVVACGLSGGSPAALGAGIVGAVNWLPWLGVEDVPVRLAHLWSIGLELQGYAVLAGLALLSRRGGLDPVRLIGSVVALGWAVLGWQAVSGAPLPYYTTFWRPDARLSAMLLGALCVTAHDQGRLRLGPWHAWPLAVLAGLLAQVNAVPDVLKYTVGAALLALGCAGLARTPGAAPAWLAHPLLTALGQVSYSVYLWQQLFYADKGPLRWPVALLLAVAAGWVAHHLWDRRLHRWALSAASAPPPPR